MDRKPILPKATTSLTSLAPSPDVGDVRPWVHQIAQEVESLKARLRHLEEEIHEVSKQGSANRDQLMTLTTEVEQVKGALANVSETLGRIMASQANFEKFTKGELAMIRNIVTGSSVDLAQQNNKMATKKMQTYGVIIGAIGTALLNALLNWLGKQ